MKQELIALLNRIRRNSRDPSDIAACDYGLNLATQADKPQQPKTDRRAYMQAYMRDYRQNGPKRALKA